MNTTHVGIHVGIVWNPSKAERDALEKALASALDATGESDFEVPEITWHETLEDDPGQRATAAALAAGADLVLAVGGDGTVRAVAEQLANEQRAGDAQRSADLGIIPMGTGNLLARNLGVPLGDLSGAFTLALSGESRPLDLGWAELGTVGGAGGETGGEPGVDTGAATTRYAFAVMAGFGIDAHMITETNDDLKDKAGWLAYIESLGRAVAASDLVEMTASFDGEAPTRLEAHTLLVGNCGMLQGGITLLPDADPSDGELDLLVLSADGVAGWIDTMRNMVWDNGLMRLLKRKDKSEDGLTAESSASADHSRITSLVIELDTPRVFEVDGDDLHETTRIEISVQPAAIRVRA
ncbi:diacylglycerol/lipid kinase family protein [Leucobacter denitrificans]|uniref:NAD(+)/NADH kinase n=1 Tax=Leucobacter denitrificans TaxID=683042 RepID=A0A7G9S693_9MICO|nr:diacylglycerol kinase family protein [Leucobacter denitrificans]QNN63368.1 NAD(+)/NADH kinase [Leucobacter denitrificans]